VSALTKNNLPLIIGHRGASAFAPENTMAAFNLAIESGAEGIEFDVRLSRDQIPVIIHDDTLLRTAGLPNRVSDLSLKDLSQVDVGAWFTTRGQGTDFSGEKIPRLETLLRWAESSGTHLYLEMKSEANQRHELAKAVSTLLAHFDPDKVVVESFDLEALKIMKNRAPLVRTAALFEPSLTTPPRFRTAQLLERAYEAGAAEIALHHRLVNKRIVELAHERGYEVVVWTVDDPKWIDRARLLKVSALITNNPRLLVVQRNRVVDG